MTSSNPISPPTNEAEPNPLSPVHHTSSFPHQTSANVATRTPFINTSTPAINAAPVELDGIPTSPDELKRRHTGDGMVSPGLGEEEDIEEEFLGEGERGAGRSKRAAMLASRSKDPGVIVDLPSYPTAEEVEAAKIAEGTVTPAVVPPPPEGET
ncbi:hypothetical protein K458DRAFT_308659 [Lentithecium fluviatile CBS 122367]|uniref:Uncharacterized protein n=1 Tax=Lentithecium fluviatile CBS 122367 TaxID=1168545 RepID=A0A6G1IUL4_9PLEO|nr:hypothetical protein K458DRAFT_308659 [Lentithecium fluviatile CBS 122367]